MRWSALGALGLAAAGVACGDGRIDGGPGPLDADLSVSFPDAAADLADAAPDARPGQPDAAGPGTPDAAPPRPDAAGPGTPDAAPPPPDAGPPEPATLAGITALHDQVRAEVGVDPMTWSPALAATAQAWAEQCIQDHNPDRSDGHPYYVGENILFSAPGTASAELAVDAWAAEKEHYDHASNSCAAGKVCGHYTQLVWADSVDLGCGVATCPSFDIVVCNYGPGGNVVGESPY